MSSRCVSYWDQVHGMIQVPQKFDKLLKSPEFCRMKKVKQNGTANYVYSGAEHTRAAHMLGTAHLTLTFMNNLTGLTKEDKLTSEERNELYLAALLHDIGHAPFSHQFESQVCARLVPAMEWSHEVQSERIVCSLIERYNIDNVSSKKIVDLINGEIVDKSKPWLSEIVANDRNCLDVDKFDYLQRDTLNIFGDKIKNSYDIIMSKPMVIGGEICYPSKYKDSIHDVFTTRYKMYNKVYMHSDVVGIGFMIADAILHANHVFNIPETLHDMHEFSNYNDTIIDRIYTSEESSLNTSKALIKRVLDGKYYKEVPKDKKYVNLPVPTPEELLKHNTSGKSITTDDFIIHSYRMNYGRKTNPIYDVTFYDGIDKSNINTSKMEDSVFIPREAEERIVHFYSKYDRKATYIKKMVNSWHSSYISVGRE